MIRNVAFAALLALLPPGTAGAQVRPEPGQGDMRIQHVQYVPELVVLIEAAVGYQVTVKLAPDEQVQSIAVGDAGTWQVSANAKGDHLFIKPLQGGQSTNMTVITDTRLYAFELSPASSPGASAYMVEFRYARPADTVQPAAELPPMIGHYKLSGDRRLQPAAIGDDGQRTYIEWIADGPLPAVYISGDRRQETLANGHMRDGLYVIEGVFSRLAFRIDKDVARAQRLQSDDK